MSARTAGALCAAFGLATMACVASTAHASSTPVIDGFDRQVAGAWGDIPSGQTWTHPSGKAPVRVAGSEAEADLPAGRETRATVKGSTFLAPVVAANFRIPAQTTFYGGLESRAQGDGRAYRSRLRVRTDGGVEVEVTRRAANGDLTLLCRANTGLTARPGQLVHLQSRTSGSSPVTVSVRANLDGQATPDWQVVCVDGGADRLTDSGAVGASLYTDVAGTVSFADFSARETAQDPVPVATATTRAPATVAPTTAPTARPTATDTTKPTTAPTAQPTTAPTTVRPTTAPTTTQPPRTVVATDVTSGDAGSVPVGQASYPVPGNALHVSPSGNDGASGQAGQPLRTLAAALQKVTSGQTIVLHGGSYHEADLKTPQDKSITIQNAPGEAAWLDGSRQVSGFQQQGSVWVKDGWDVALDASPTFDRGAPDNGGTWWKFVNDAHPMAAHPDQVWVNGQTLRQVASRGQVTAGTFFVDRGAHQLVVGTNPNGAQVQATDLADGLTVLGANTTVRGIGLRRYGNAVPDMGALTVYGTGFTAENVVVDHAATGGIGLYRSGAKLTKVTVADAGMLAVQGNEADNLTLDRMRITGANAEHFNATPAAGSIKVTRSRTVTVRNSVINGGDGNGVWADESSYDLAVVNSTIQGNTGRGIFVELSEKATIVGNRIVDNGGDQVRIADTANVQLWNNTITGSTVPVQLGQDKRNASTDAYAVDKRHPGMSWVISGTTIGNNILQSSGKVTAMLMVEDWSKRFTGAQMVAANDGNVYSRAGGSATGLVVWANGGSDPKVAKSLDEVRSKTGRESRGQYAAQSVVDGRYTLRGDAGIDAGKAVAMPGDVAGRAGISAPGGVLGAWS